LYSKTLKWLSEKKDFKLFSNKDMEDGWLIEFKKTDEYGYIYSSNKDFIRVESVLKFPFFYLDKPLLNSLFILAFDEGCYMSEPGTHINECVIRYGFVIPVEVFGMKTLFSYIDSLGMCSMILEEHVNDYVVKNEVADLDLSMFISDKLRLSEFNLEFLIELKDQRFKGNWKLLKEFIETDKTERGKVLSDYIDRCVKFEEANHRSLSDVYKKVREELSELEKDMQDNTITYN